MVVGPAKASRRCPDARTSRAGVPVVGPCSDAMLVVRPCHMAPAQVQVLLAAEKMPEATRWQQQYTNDLRMSEFSPTLVIHSLHSYKVVRKPGGAAPGRRSITKADVMREIDARVVATADNH